MTPSDLVFLIPEALIVVGALALLFIRQVFHAALIVIGMLICIAVVYFLQYAEFVAVTQVLIYAGGILVIILFGIMLTSRIAGRPLRVENQHRIGGTLVGVLLFALLLSVYSWKNIPFNSGSPQELSPERIGIAFMTDYLLPFEVAGFLLLIALIGAALMAVSSNSSKNPNGDGSR